MKEVLLNPHTGYYTTKDNVFGDEGDFITAPEIGQIFGELIAVWCINELQKFNYDGQIQLVELGPGKGTLMLDMLRVYERFGFSTERISVHLVELSPHLQRVQGERLCNGQVERSGQSESYVQRGTTGNGVNIFWYPDIVELPRGFSIVIANEFFDALPAHVFCKEVNDDGGPGWKEVLIDINPDATVPSFRFIQSTKRTPYSVVFGKRFHDKAHLLQDRSRVEVSFEMEQIAQNIANRFADSGGFGLIVDYGHHGNKSDTFRSFKSHKLHDPLVNPGDADLTVDVDFGFLKYFLEQDDKAFTLGPVGQGTFLSAMQGSKRLEDLLQSSTSQEWKKSLIAGYEALTNPAKMGERFKVLAVFPAALKQHLLTGNNVIGFRSQVME
ncbi:protein arginine methyltransferase NDUFAF7 homolog, mitochondrial [Anopheles bellator]|uniref:protein arginine methyltransferase NDUFAF7 homolog, mitochondrial n=1 Tax=Anopheles bellator TaxID=139047 RepID=UPI0026489D83|nr:protein arginine methyltransferase NDUFAF7 homolog, mitochondrial [Anopheles bellator]